MTTPNRSIAQARAKRLWPDSAEQQQAIVASAHRLAAGLRAYRPRQDLPPALWETAYLLEEGQNPQRSLLERLRIFGLMATSLDQFFIEELPRWQEESHPNGVAGHWHDELPRFVETTLQQASHYLNGTLLPALVQSFEIEITTPANVPPAESRWLRTFFEDRVFPLLTPLAIDPGHPFPFISSFSLNFLVQLRAQQPEAPCPARQYARLKVPRLLPRMIAIPNGDNGHAGRGSKSSRFVRSEEVVRQFLPALFPGLVVEGAYLFRVVRALSPRPSRELSWEQSTRRRELSLPVVRLDVEQMMPPPLLEWLVRHLEVPPYACFRLPNELGELHLVDLANLLEGIPAVESLYAWPAQTKTGLA